MDWQQVLATRNSRMKASEIRELLKLLDQPDILSFAGGIPDPALFPVDAFRGAFAEALSDGAASSALQYSVSEGYKPLREWIACEMEKIGVPCDANNILITSGSQQALDYLGKLMISQQDTVLLGWPTYLGALGAFNAYEPTYDRLDPGTNRAPADFASRAAAAGGRVKFAYLSVDFANPTGETLNRAAREAVIDLADQMDIAVVEDAAYQTLRYDGAAVPPILALEIARKGSIEDCRTLYCGSFSKSLAPGLRVGWICGAAQVISRLVLMKQAADLHSSTLNQIVVHRVAASGRTEKACTKVNIEQHHRYYTRQHRHYRNQQIRSNQPGPYKHRHFHISHTGCTQILDGGNNVDGTHDRRGAHNVNGEDEEGNGRRSVGRG